MMFSARDCHQRFCTKSITLRFFSVAFCWKITANAYLCSDNVFIQFLTFIHRCSAVPLWEAPSNKADVSLFLLLTFFYLLNVDRGDNVSCVFDNKIHFYYTPQKRGTSSRIAPLKDYSKGKRHEYRNIRGNPVKSVRHSPLYCPLDKMC